MRTITLTVALLTIAASANSLAQGPTDSNWRQPPFPTLKESQWLPLAIPEVRRTEGRLPGQGQSKLAITDGTTPICVQDTLALTPGARVRISAPDLLGPEALIGNVVALRGDTLVVHKADASGAGLRLPLAQVDRLEVSRGGRSRGTGAAIGFLVGAAVGGIYGAAGHPGLAHTDIPEEGETAIYAGVAGLIGAAIGAALGGERWKHVPLSHRISIAPHRPGGFAISARLAFPSVSRPREASKRRHRGCSRFLRTPVHCAMCRRSSESLRRRCTRRGPCGTALSEAGPLGRFS